MVLKGARAWPRPVVATAVRVSPTPDRAPRQGECSRKMSRCPMYGKAGQTQRSWQTPQRKLNFCSTQSDSACRGRPVCIISGILSGRSAHGTHRSFGGEIRRVSSPGFRIGWKAVFGDSCVPTPGHGAAGRAASATRQGPRGGEAGLGARSSTTGGTGVFGRSVRRNTAEGGFAPSGSAI